MEGPPIGPLLQPVPGENPAGASLRTSELYRLIPRALAGKDDEDSPIGGESPVGGSSTGSNLSALADTIFNALRTRSKDLKLCVWLAEGAVRSQGLPELAPALDLIAAMLETWWEPMYPSLADEGGLQNRRDALQNLFGMASDEIATASLTHDGLSLRSRKTWTAEHEKLTPQHVASLERAAADSEAALAAVGRLEAACKRFGSSAPDLQQLRTGLTTIHQFSNSQCEPYRKRKPVEPVPDVTEVIEEAGEPESVAGTPEIVGVETARIEPVRQEPVTPELLVRRILDSAAELRKLTPEDPVAYLVTRAVRWGQLRSVLDSEKAVEGPTSETRKMLNQHAMAQEWEELASAAENAAASVCGQVWLDPHWYAWKAASEAGREHLAMLLRETVRCLVARFPDLPQLRFDDTTSVAGDDTRKWLEAMTAAERKGPPETKPAEAEEKAPAVEVMNSEPVVETALSDDSGRARFLLRLKEAEALMNSGHPRIALPVLTDLAGELDRRGLSEWESTAFVISVLRSLHRCLGALDAQSPEREQVYVRICRLDTHTALALSAEAGA